MGRHTPNASVADHSVSARDESHESEASWALMFCFDNVSPEKACHICIRCIPDTIHLTLKMTSAQVVKTSVTYDSSFENYPYPDDLTRWYTDTPEFKNHLLNYLTISICRDIIYWDNKYFFETYKFLTKPMKFPSFVIYFILLKAQGAQTLFVIYIRDSIALCFEPFKRMYENGSKSL